MTGRVRALPERRPSSARRCVVPAEDNGTDHPSMCPEVERLSQPGNGPLIVQSDKTLLLEVDHAGAPAARQAIAPFAELERAPEHVHTYRVTPLALWNARAAGHDAEQVVDALVRYSPLRGAAAAARRRRRHDGPLRAPAADELPRARPGHDLPRPRGARGGPAQQEDRPDARRPHRRRHGRRAPVRARAAQAGAAQGRLARRGPRGLRRRRGPRDRARPDRLGAARLPGRRRRGLLGTAAPAWSCCPAARARRSSAPRRWRRPGRPR